jgi:hypothetical protein
MKNIRERIAAQYLTKISIKTGIINFENTILFTVPFRGYTFTFLHYNENKQDST